MKKRVLLAAIAAACLFIGPAHGRAIQFYQANMSGAQEVPPNASTGSGLVNFQFDTDTSTLTLTSGNYQNMLTNVTASHIHGPAPVGMNADVLITLNNTGGLSGTLSMPATVLTAAQIGWLQTSLLYVNVHTTMFPGGEIRGQILLVPAPAALAVFGAFGLIRPRRRRSE